MVVPFGDHKDCGSIPEVSEFSPASGGLKCLATAEGMGQGALVREFQFATQGNTVGDQENCVACHGENGQGYIGPALNGSAHAWHHPDPLLVSFIRDGIPDTQMPAQRDNLTDEEIDAVISYMKSWWSPRQRRMQQQGQR